MFSTLQAAASHVAFGVTSPEKPATPMRQPARAGSKAAAGASSATVADAGAGSAAGSRRGSPQRVRNATGEYEVTVTLTPGAPVLVSHDAAAPDADEE